MRYDIEVSGQSLHANVVSKANYDKGATVGVAFDFSDALALAADGGD